MIIFSTKEYVYLQQLVLQQNESFLEGKLDITLFPDGEIYHRILTEVQGKDVAIIGGTVNDSATLELFDIAEGCVQYGANSITIVIPYFGYSTMERMVHPGEIVKARNRALLFSAIPSANQKTTILLFDLHSEGIPYYFDSTVRTTHVYCKPIIIEAARQLAGNDFVLAATDAGRAKWVESLADEMQVQAAFVYKNRSSGSQTTITGINADVDGKKVVIYDDMIRTGGSLMQAAEQYHRKGASLIFVMTTHGLFTNNALDKIAAQGLIAQVVCTNSHSNTNSNNHTILQVKSIAGLIAKELNNKNDY
jgi:ribose-phosphate pyrophosphokinase